MTRIGSWMGALLLMGALISACASTSTPSSGYGAKSSSGTADVPTTGPTITISQMAFGEPLTVAPGATITIVNRDSVEHSVTSKPEPGFDTDVDGGAQKTFTAPTKPGVYPFICTYHPKMSGTLTVT
ncbi:cupredoxin domain-containing protein [Mycolicibacterium sp.]|uniref:cupredoxin domain-containing protein n=1 Tax=Mycolicibacterium sp. TaxID=2320850 RepID=UPI001A34BF54|nr:cupredoxin domain-containing protein [Mycolicibacterium sp.]MBJ7339192.1 cupredoxin domain-containing protein [Mycolicibacterium sp.]